MHKSMLILILSVICNISYSGKTAQENFDAAIAKHQHTAKNFAQPGNLHPIKASDYTKEDTDNVAAKNYHDNPSAMENKAKQQTETDKTAKAINNLNVNHRHTIDLNNPAYQQAMETQNNAEKILSDQGGRYNCTEVRGKGSTKTHIETCQVSNVVPMQCIKYPEVRIVEVPYQAPTKFTGSLIKYGQYSYGLSLPESGTITGISVNFWHEGHNSFFCHTTYNAYINGQYLGSYRKSDCYHLFYYLPFSKQGLHISAQAGKPISITFNGGGLDEWLNRFPYTVNATVTRYKKEAKVTWKDTCQNVNPKACVQTKDQCIEPGGTRNISGVNVHQDCWKYDLAYTCGYKKHDNCDDIAKRCNYIAQTCIEEADGYCYAYERKYQCSEVVEGTKELICGDPKHIQFTQKIEQGTGEDFAKAAAGLAGLGALGKDLKNKQSNIGVLIGKPYNCGEAGLGLYDCCDSGGNFIRQCSDSEKALQAARRKNLAIFTGRHCAKKALGVCLVHHQGWCVFDSKLMRIIQGQGRPQLGLSFGSGEHPDCRGLTPDELQRIDFTRIDFSEVYRELNFKKPTDPDIEKAMRTVFQQNKQAPKYNQHNQDAPLLETLTMTESEITGNRK